jgi:hypothetical protein
MVILVHQLARYRTFSENSTVIQMSGEDESGTTHTWTDSPLFAPLFHTKIITLCEKQQFKIQAELTAALCVLCMSHASDKNCWLCQIVKGLIFTEDFMDTTYTKITNKNEMIFKPLCHIIYKT